MCCMTSSASQLNDQDKRYSPFTWSIADMSQRGRPSARRGTSQRRQATIAEDDSPISPRRLSPRLNGSPQYARRQLSSPEESRARGLSPSSPRESRKISPRGIAKDRPPSPLRNVTTAVPESAPAPLVVQNNYLPPKRVNRTQVQKTQKSFSDLSQIAGRIIANSKRGKFGIEDIYKYVPLSDPKQVRLLAISPSKVTSSPIFCRLVVVPFEPGKTIVYEALSYMWGTDEPNMEIKIASPSFSRLNPRRERQNRKLHYDVHIARFWKRFFIRPNLHAALQHLRDSKENIYLWVDALCIDQDNKEERSVQVSMMAEIYSRAAHVCIWLGGGNLQSQVAFSFVPILLHDTNIDVHLEGESAYSSWYALAEVMKNQWFSRRWVLQEVALAREASLHCGNESLHWADFADAVMIFLANFDKINSATREIQMANPSRQLGNIHTGAYALVKIINNYLRKSANGVERLASLETLVSVLLSYEASEPRDTIYAVLSLAKDAIEGNPSSQLDDDIEPIRPDYKKPVIDVFKDFIDFAIQTSESLDIICRHWAPVPQKKEIQTLSLEIPFPRVKRRRTELFRREKYPSWIPSVSGSPYGTPVEALTGRKHGDNFVGTSERPTYNATPKTRPIYHFREVFDHLPPEELRLASPFYMDDDANPFGIHIPSTTAIHNTATPMSTLGSQTTITKPWWSMHVKGFRLDNIKHLAGRVARGVIPRECLQLIDWQWPAYHDEVDIPDIPAELWRTMVADRGPDGDNPPIFYERACQKCLARSIGGDIEILKLMDEVQDVMVIDFLKRVEKVTWDRKFLRSEGRAYESRGKLVPKKLFGLAPPRAERKDIICILLGCSVPVILREHHLPERYFEFIGEAYIYGMMSGEALGGRKMDTLLNECEDFELR